MKKDYWSWLMRIERNKNTKLLMMLLRKKKNERLNETFRIFLRICGIFLFWHAKVICS
jgi:hypothetical protein